MDFDLMITSLPKLLSATLITLKLLSVSLIVGMFLGLFFAILRMSKNIFINQFAYGYSYSFLKLQKIAQETSQLLKKHSKALM